MSDFAASSEYAQFRVTFFEECAEILADLEGRLIGLQSASADREELNAIFRAVHSIKAGAGAFQFVEMVRFTHSFEAVLDRLRDGRIDQSPRLVACLTSAGDILAAMVEAAQSGSAVPDAFGADVAEELLHFLAGPGMPAVPAAGARAAASAPPIGAEKAASRRRVRIEFRPHREMFRHANEPLLLIRELKRLGELDIACDRSRLPSLDRMDPEDAYLAWTFHLTTGRPDSEIAEVFEFVDQDCDLIIVAETSEAEAIAAPEVVVAEPAALAAPAAASPAPAAASPAPSAAVPAPANSAAKQGATGSIRVDLPRVDRLVNMVGELVITQAMLAQQIAELGITGNTLLQGQEDLAVLTRELQECVMAIRMQPVKSVFARMPRLVREISAKIGKQVKLVTSGEQTEVDKTVIEELADPLTHMIRNSVDHGIEDVETRRAKGKPDEGTITLSAAHIGSNIVIHIADDGAGLNKERLFAKAVEKGIIAPDAILSEDEIHDLIFAAGFSTAAAVTELSGRGVGMDVVRRNITNLGGRVQVSSVFGKGTRFTLMIPLTLAVLDGMIVAVGSEKYILPLTSIIESYRPDAASIRALPGGGDVAAVRGEYNRLIYLHRIFDVAGAVTDPSKGLVVLVETARGEKVGIVVDELIGQQQVVIKSLQENFDPVEGISGATILGNGRVALILDIEQLTLMTSRSRQSVLRERGNIDLSPAAASAAA